MDRGAWLAIVHGVRKNRIWLKGLNSRSIMIYWGHITLILPCGGGALVVKSYPTLATPWTVGHQAPLSMGFSRQECWSGLPFPSPWDLLTQESNPGLLHCRQILYWWAKRCFPLNSSWRTLDQQKSEILCKITGLYSSKYKLHGKKRWTEKLFQILKTRETTQLNATFNPQLDPWPEFYYYLL